MSTPAEQICDLIEANYRRQLRDYAGALMPGVVLLDAQADIIANTYWVPNDPIFVDQLVSGVLRVDEPVIVETKE